MPKPKYTEEEWLDFILVQHAYPDWTVNLQEAYWDAFEAESGSVHSDENRHLLACKFIKNGPSRTRDRKKWNCLVETHPIIAVKNLKELTKWVSDVLDCHERIATLHLDDKRKIVQSALKREHPETSLAKTKYSNWLRYAYWTEEEAVEFILGTDDHPLFNDRVAKAQKTTAFRNKSGHIIPLDFYEWATDEKWAPFFNRKDIGEMSPDNFDTLPPNRRNSYHKLLLAMAKERFSYPKGQRKEIESACDRQGYTLSSDTIKSILEAACKDLELDRDQQSD